MRKLTIILILGVVLLIGCNGEDVTLAEKPETKVITTGEIMTLNETNGEYKVTIGEKDEELKCIWFNTDEVTEEEYNNLNVGDTYTIKD